MEIPFFGYFSQIVEVCTTCLSSDILHCSLCFTKQLFMEIASTLQDTSELGSHRCCCGIQVYIFWYMMELMLEDDVYQLVCIHLTVDSVRLVSTPELQKTLPLFKNLVFKHVQNILSISLIVLCRVSWHLCVNGKQYCPTPPITSLPPDHGIIDIPKYVQFKTKTLQGYSPFLLNKIKLLSRNYKSNNGLSESGCDSKIQSKCNGHHSPNPTQDLVLVSNNVTLTIPKLNLSKQPSVDFTIAVVTDPMYKPKLDSWSVLASSIIHLGPHGTKFLPNAPAIVKIPIGVAIEEDDIVEFLSSDTDLNEQTIWQKINSTNVCVSGNYVQFEVTHFSLFAVVVSKPRPKVSRRILRSIGGTLVLSGDDEISVEFPRNSFCMSEIDASVELLYYDAFYVSNDLFEASTKKSLAGPLVSLGPNGCKFEYPVHVTMPLPKAKEVQRFVGNPSLILMYSETSIGEKPVWQSFETDYTINWNVSPCTVTFSVRHFTLFSVFWDLLDVSLPDNLKLHASTHIPHFSFWVNFHVLMTECSHSKHFGLCVLCLRFGSDTRSALSQYPVEVGMCTPKKIKTGKLMLRLSSGMFHADESAGETLSDLTKVVDFDGHNFDVQFGCVFTTSSPPSSGLFGKMEVNTVDTLNGQFSINLVKGISSQAKPNLFNKIPSKWEGKVTEELAGLLSIDKHMWQELALALGYNRMEIQTKFLNARQPIQEMLADFMTRGGEPDEFVNAMYRVARIHKLLPLDEIRENQQNRHLERELARDADLPGSSVEFCVNPSNVPGKRKSDVLYGNERLTEAKFDDIAGEISKNWKTIGRKLNVSEPELREIELNYQHAGEKEKAFQMLMTWRERDPDNCISATLHTVLHNCGMKYTAMKCLQ